MKTLIRIVVLSALLFIVLTNTTGCATGGGRRGSIGGFRVELSGPQLKKATPACVWNGNCKGIDGMFEKVAHAK